ncbi:MAG: hypothetical protein WA843_00015, partial [Candidatus Saccharimonadales bacterium]
MERDACQRSALIETFEPTVDTGVAAAAVEAEQKSSMVGSAKRTASRLLALSLSMVAASAGPALAKEVPPPTHQPPPVGALIAEAGSSHAKGLSARNKPQHTRDQSLTTALTGVVEQHKDLGAPAQERTSLMQIGSEDEAIAPNGDAMQLRTVTSLAHGMGAEVWRLMVHPQAIFKHDWKNTDLDVQSAEAAGMQVMLTITCENVHWTDKSFYQAVAAVARRYGASVRLIALCNEPNLVDPTTPHATDWLRERPGMTQAQTYREMWDVGSAAVTSTNPNDTPVFGEISSEGRRPNDPLSFLYEVAMADCPNPAKQCQPLVVPLIAYHPYQLDRRPTMRSQKGQAGIGSLAALEYEINLLHSTGMLTTPD